MMDGASSRSAAARVLREPLVHFILVGTCLFSLFSWLGPDDEKSSRQIVVTQDRLLEFMQYRNQTFSGSARNRLDEMLSSMTPSQKSALIEDYVREEVLHREALALGLDHTDYVIRRRLAQTMEYILRGTPDEDLTPPDDAELEKYFLANIARYESPERVSLRHVYFESGPADRSAEDRARSVLDALSAQKIDFEDALARSDRFPYFQDYADEPRPLIESHLGSSVADAAFDPSQNPSWQGPYRSRGGIHLIQVTRRAAPKTPDFASIKEVVVNDWRTAKTEERLEARIRGLIGEYRVESTVQ
jgi:parvulin-like peptidyl-prolyl isomerase